VKRALFHGPLHRGEGEHFVQGGVGGIVPSV
jgi:hypothetical protein